VSERASVQHTSGPASSFVFLYGRRQRFAQTEGATRKANRKTRKNPASLSRRTHFLAGDARIVCAEKLTLLTPPPTHPILSLRRRNEEATKIRTSSALALCTNTSAGFLFTASTSSPSSFAGSSLRVASSSRVRKGSKPSQPRPRVLMKFSGASQGETVPPCVAARDAHKDIARSSRRLASTSQKGDDVSARKQTKTRSHTRAHTTTHGREEKLNEFSFYMPIVGRAAEGWNGFAKKSAEMLRLVSRCVCV
jgi:hypothetical protein